MVAILDQKSERLGFSNVQTSTQSIDDLAAATSGLVAKGFDLIVCSSVCGFLDDYPGSVQTLCGLLKPGGMFVQWDWEFIATSSDPFGLTREKIAAAIRDAGMQSISVDTAFSVEVGDQMMRPLMGVGQKR